MQDYDTIKSSAEEVARRMILEIGPGKLGASGKRRPSWLDEVSFAIGKAVKQSMPSQIDETWCMQMLTLRPELLSKTVVHGAPIKLAGVIRGAVADLVVDDLEKELRAFQQQVEQDIEAAREAPTSIPQMR